MINQLPICDFDQNLISNSQSIDKNLHLIKNVKSPVNIFGAVNKTYDDRVKYKTATGTIPNTVMTDHTLFTFPTTPGFASEKIIICDMWFERFADEWITTSSQMFATEWPGFHKFSNGSSFMTFFTGFLLVAGPTIFVSTI